MTLKLRKELIYKAINDTRFKRFLKTINTARTDKLKMFKIIFDRYNKNEVLTIKKYNELTDTYKTERRAIIKKYKEIGQRRQNIIKQKKYLNEGKINELLKFLVITKQPLEENLFEQFYNQVNKSNNYLIIDELLMSKDDAIKKKRYLPVSDKNKSILKLILINLYTTSSVSGMGSDTFDDVNLNSVENLELIKPKPRKNKQKNGAYFKYENTTNEDLTRYQIYKKDDKQDSENCLIHVLKTYNISDDKINEIKKFMIGGEHIKKSDLYHIANIIDKNINLYYYDEKIKKIKNNFICEKVSTPKEELKIAIFENHYFIYEDTKYSSYCIDHYDELKDKKEFYDIYKKDRYNKTERKINSLNLVVKLFKHGYFIEKDQSDRHEYKADKEETINLNYIASEQQPTTKKERIKKNDYKKIIYADTETITNGDKHKLFLLGYVSDDNDEVNILCVNDFEDSDKHTKEQLLIYKFLNNITKYGTISCIIYFHNLKYDHHILEPYLNISSKCVKDGQFYSVESIYKKSKIEMRDSYKLIPFALNKFCSEFQLPSELNKKEAIAYDYYSSNTLDYNKTNIEAYKKYIPNTEHEIFYENIKQFLTGQTTFDALGYYKYYLKYDCLVLKHGLLKFNEMILKITDNKMNIFESLTISSLTDKYMYLEGAYDDIYEINRNLRDYIGRAVYGGRVCVNKLYEKKIVEGRTADYDGVSLYPSAIKRICDEIGGLPTGEAIRFNENELLNWSNKIYSILTVKITKVNKKQQMPMIAIKGDITKYTNDVPDDIMVIDSITLEDYINFHHIEYEILDGVYWNKTTNKKMGDVIQRLFNERIKNKKSNPAIANVLKLMLNSSYGKTILKKSDTKSIIKSNDYVDDYLYNNFNTIKEIVKLNDYKSEVINFTADTSYNRCHIGVAILSMSKRIMNEVFDIANDHDIKIYYTDTDSIHMEYDKTNLLEQLYYEKYNKVLNGKNLGQFHNDFNLSGAVGDVYASRSIFLGKKCYIDEMQGKNDKGEIIKDYHFRLKGITEAGMLYHIKKNYDNDAFKMYEALMSGDKLKVLLNPEDEELNKKKILFEFKKGFGVSTKNEFYREVSF